MPVSNPIEVIGQDEGVEIARRYTLNFAGAGVTVSDDATNKRIIIAISGGTSYSDASALAAVNISGLALAAGRSIQLGALTSGDHTYSVPECDSQTAGENLVFGNVCFPGSGAKFYKAKCNSVVTMPGVAIAVQTMSSEAGLFMYAGKVRDDSWAWTSNGAILFVDISTAGVLTQSLPPAGGFAQPVAVALTSNIILMKPSLVMVEVK